MPARKVVGYVREATDKPLEYRLNGPLVLVVLALLWVLFGPTGVLAWDWLYVHRWSGLVGAVVLGLLFTLALVLTVPGRAVRSWPISTSAARRTGSSSAAGWTRRCSST